jgi:hypothetical protein
LTLVSKLSPFRKTVDINLNLVIYYASNVFVSLGLTGGTIALLATGVTGVVFLVSTIPAMVS